MSISVDGRPWKCSDSFPSTHRSHYRKMSPHFPSTRRLINFWKEERERNRWWDWEAWHLPSVFLWAYTLVWHKVDEHVSAYVSLVLTRSHPAVSRVWKFSPTIDKRQTKVGQTSFHPVILQNSQGNSEVFPHQMSFIIPPVYSESAYGPNSQ